MPRIPIICFVFLGLLTDRCLGENPDRDQLLFFENSIRPLLSKKCFSCHSEQKGKTKGSLNLDSKAGMLQGGDRGPAIVAHKPVESLLLTAMKFDDPDLQMPPAGKLSDEEIDAVSRWIAMGAPWPGENPASNSEIRPAGKISDEDRKWWAFQKIEDPPVAVVAGGEIRNPIDNFLEAKRREKKLTPSPEASRSQLIRRVYYDLIGLPPTAADVSAYERDKSPDAYERMVDRLLASPQYAERWARYWLDLVRYAESDGYKADHYRPTAWMYRDYVIKSFREDKPFDRFIAEQLAGDEIDPDNPEARVATGFLRLWIYEYNQRDVRTQWDVILNDVTDVAGDVFLGMGMACARCHDHKYDPILQRDYYRLQAFFAPILPRDDVASASRMERYREQLAVWNEKASAIRKEMEAIERPLKARLEKDAIERFPPDIRGMLRKKDAERAPYEKQIAALAYRQVEFEWESIETKLKGDTKKRWTELKKALAKLGPKPELNAPLTVTDVGRTGPETTVPKKSSLGVIEPGPLSVLDERPTEISSAGMRETTGRRTALARWLTSDSNPLFARVMVNRIWQQHFGRGIVGTSSDFGRLGEKPSHPELLDWLAKRFVENGWRLKPLHRLMVTSAAYRQTSANLNVKAAEVDPQNTLLWKMNRRRLDADQIRDALFALSGELEDVSGGPSAKADSRRRTIYTRVLRNDRDPLLDVFDFPDGIQSMSQRNATTTATQSLVMLNSPFVLKAAKQWSNVIVKSVADQDDRLDSAFRAAFARLPTESERASLLKFVSDRGASGWYDVCHVLLNANEFVYID